MTVTLPRPLAPASRRTDPAHYTPEHLPAELTEYETPVEGLGVGRVGKVGLLELTFAPVAGVTAITHHFQQFPLQVFRPFYLDPHRPEMPFVYVMSHGGTLQGDRTRLDLVCAPGASAHITTQAAAKLYRMEHNYATQLVNLEAGEGSFLEYLPDPVIPFRDSRFFTRTQLTVHPSATAILGETLLPGRVAYGEHHAYALYASQLEARTPEGELLFADTLKFAPERTPLHSPGQLGPHAALATLYVVTRQLPAKGLADRLHERLAALPSVVGGASELPNDSGAWARIFGPDSLSVSGALHAVWDEARLALTGAPAPRGRKT